MTEQAKQFIQKRKKWNKRDIALSAVIFVCGVIFLRNAYGEGAPFDIALYGFICGAAPAWFANACLTLQWLRVIEEIEEKQ